MHASRAQLAPLAVEPPDLVVLRRDPAPAAPDGAAGQPPAEDRSHLLRRTPRSLHLRQDDDTDDGIRLRRRRRTGGSFSGIPGLSRNGRG